MLLSGISTNLIPKLDEEWVGLISCLSMLIKLGEQLPNFHFCVNRIGIIICKKKGQKRYLLNQLLKSNLRPSMINYLRLKEGFNIFSFKCSFRA